MKAKTKKEPIPLVLLERMAQVLKLLAHPHRLQVVEMLEACGEAPVHEIMGCLELTQAATSHHLVAMKRVGLGEAERKGKEVWYRNVRIKELD